MTEQYQDRVVRVFISSTFRDMHAEREELVKYTFPELRRRCRERHVEFVDVDLRWGVTEEQTERGEVLPICLSEIERCHPYFIGLLGERYGSVPEEIDQRIIDDQPWLEEHKEKSITELEILHGVLKNIKMENRAFFYFRDPELSRQVETALSRESDYQPEPDVSKNKQSSLKERIIKNGYPKESYEDVKTLGQRVLKDLWVAIDVQFPESETPSYLEQARLEHEAFAAARRKVYIGRQEYIDRLDAHVRSDEPPLVLLGESGSGKSALIANWVETHRKKHPDDFVLLHFVGSTPDSADYVKLLQRIILEIKAHIEPVQAVIDDTSGKVVPFNQDNEEDVPSDPQKLIEVFPLWLAKAAAKGTFILILDGLNQLEDRDNALDMTWLPQYIPPHVRLIASTLPGRSLDAVHKRNWLSLHIEPLDTHESRTLIAGYLKRFSKTLNESQIQEITDSKQTTNPLYLKTLLDELRVFGSHEKLNARIEYYLQAKTIDALFDRMLDRLEQDYERDHPGLTRKVMSLIWASRQGLSETELLEILNLPQAVWSPLKLAVEESLVSRSGLLNFFHDYLRQAVQHRYVKVQEHQQKVHLRIADYFQERELDQRKIEELPWQLQHAESWERLKDCITEHAMFLELHTDKYKYELTRYWLGIGDRFEMTACYQSAIKQYESTSPAEQDLSLLLNKIAVFLELNAKYKGAEPLYRRALEINEAAYGPGHPHVATGLNNLAELLRTTNRLPEAEPLYRRALAIDEAAYGPDHPTVAISFNNLAVLLAATNRHTEAEPLYRRALAIDEAAYGPDHPNVAIRLNNLAYLLHTTNRHTEAEPLYRRALAIDEAAYGPDHPDVARGLNNLAELLAATNRHTEAEPLFRRALAINEAAYGPDHPHVAAVLNNLAVLLKDANRHTEAEPLYRRALAIDEAAYGTYHPSVARGLNNLAELLAATNRHTEAEPLFRRALAINEAAYGPDHPRVAIGLSNLAELLKITNRLPEAEPLYRRALSIDEAAYGTDHPRVAIGLSCLAALLTATNRHTEAEPLYRRALSIDEAAYGPDHPDVALQLNNLAVLLKNTNRHTEAEPLYRRALAINEAAYGPDHPNVATGLSNLATLLDDTNRLPEAEPLYRRALAIDEAAYGPDHPDVALRLNNLAHLLSASNRYEDAAGLFLRAMNICLTSYGPDHPWTKTFSANLQACQDAMK